MGKLGKGKAEGGWRLRNPSVVVLPAGVRGADL
jgi:hypothetical protein